ncbi:hypothetical protein V492_03567 [Pseudogymnoascus sp. VKM F-4246]|nr:hypothetical protein V492_03567 [Pseudogymnoascus sp. VKM F-4246]
MAGRIAELEAKITTVQAALGEDRTAIYAARTQVIEEGVTAISPQRGFGLSDLTIIKGNTIFNFSAFQFEETSKEAVLTAAKKITKVTYFTRHLCRQGDINTHIPSAKWKGSGNEEWMVTVGLVMVTVGLVMVTVGLVMMRMAQ